MDVMGVCLYLYLYLCIRLNEWMDGDGLTRRRSLAAPPAPPMIPLLSVGLEAIAISGLVIGVVCSTDVSLILIWSWYTGTWMRMRMRMRLRRIIEENGRYRLRRGPRSVYQLFVINIVH